MGVFWTMELNYQDDKLIKNYLNCYFKDKEKFIELIFNPFKCNCLNNIDNNLDNIFDQKISNIKILLDYLIEENIFTNHWRLGELNDIEKISNILDIFYDYFNKIKRPGILIISNNLSFCNDGEKIQLIENYIKKFLVI